MAPQIKTEQQMFPLIEDWLKSGLTQKQVCATHQLPVHILAYWVGMYHKAQPAITVNKAETATGKGTKKVRATDSASGFIRLSSPPPLPVSISKTRAATLLPAWKDKMTYNLYTSKTDKVQLLDYMFKETDHLLPPFKFCLLPI